jgi:hypothetical protein
MSDPPSRGHNLPTLSDLLSLETVQAILDVAAEPLRARAAVLTASCLRFLQAHPTITTDEQDGTAAEILAVLQRFLSTNGSVETSRVSLKAPVLAAGRAIDATYGTIGPDLTIRSLRDRKPPFTLAEQILQAVVTYKAAKNLAKQQADEAEAARLAELARQAEHLADQGSGTVSYKDATAAAEEAEKARAVADAKPATRTRAHGSDFGTSSLNQRRLFEITQPALVPRAYCVPSDALIRAAIGKPGDAIPIIDGVTIRDVDDLTVRK